MSAATPAGRLYGVAPAELRPGEVVLYHWPSPRGRGILTNLRCLILGHPAPLRRPIWWSLDLEGIRALVVVKLRGAGSMWLGFRGSLGGGTISTGRLGPEYGVLVNGVTVFTGYPKDCEELQRRIDDARTSRCLASVGRVVPYDGLG